MSNVEMVSQDLIARGKSESTARNWSTYVRRFEECCGVKDRYERGDVVKFLADMRKQGFKQNSINTMIRPIKLLAQIQGWDFPKLAMPRVKDEDIERMAYTEEEVIELIRKARKCCTPRQVAYLAIASVYGCRREEVGSCDVNEDTVTIYTVKGGKKVEQLIPGQIKPFLKYYQKRSVGNMSRTFHQICHNCGLQNGSTGYGWHSIRRGLATSLVMKDISALNIMRFMRWSDASLKGEFGMLIIYAKREQDKIDEAVFKSHPFLSVWSEEVEGGENVESVDIEDD